MIIYFRLETNAYFYWESLLRPKNDCKLSFVDKNKLKQYLKNLRQKQG